MPQISNRSKGSTCVAEEKEIGYGKIEGDDAGNNEAVKSWIHKENTLHNLVGYGPQVFGEMKDVCGFHRPKQSVPKRHLPIAKY